LTPRLLYDDVETFPIARECLRSLKKEERKRERRTAMTVKIRMMFLALAVAILWVGAANAQGEKAEEGINFKVVRGENPSWTYVKIAKVDVNTPSLAAIFGTDMYSIRADNPTKTLALCCGEHGQCKWSPVATVEDRANDAVWKNCPESNQYVYMVPNEVIVITDTKRLSFSQEQAKIKEMRACGEDAACVMRAVKVLAPNADWNRIESKDASLVSLSVEPAPAETDANRTVAAPSPASKNKETEGVTPPPPPPPPPAPAKTDALTLIVFALAFLFLITAAVQSARLRKERHGASRQEEREERDRMKGEIKRLKKELDRTKGKLNANIIELDKASEEKAHLYVQEWAYTQLRSELMSFLNACGKALCGKEFDPANREPARAMDEFLTLVRSWARELRQAVILLREEIGGLNMEKDRDRILTGKFVEETRALLADKRDRREKTNAKNENDKRRAESELTALVHGLRALLNSLPNGQAPDAGSPENAVNAPRLLKNLEEAIQLTSYRYLELGGQMLEILLGEPRRTQTAPFNPSNHQEAIRVLERTHEKLGSALAGSGSPDDEIPIALEERASRLCQAHGERETVLRRYRCEIKKIAEENARLREAQSAGSGLRRLPPDAAFSPQSGNTLVPPNTDKSARTK
jgi:hypothetical protein